MPALQEIFRSMKPVLKIDWATHEAAKYAVENWHYSQCLPAGKLVKVGAWENKKFIGVVIFGCGANNNLSKAFKLTQQECCELVRIALTKHIAPVSQVAAFAIRFLKVQSPKLKLIVSYADPEQGHHGGIYQAGNWIYDGEQSSQTEYFLNGKQTHGRSVIASRGTVKGLRKIKVRGKHRYLMPLDNEMRKQIIPLAKPYPKRASSETIDTPGIHPGKGGETPTDALHSANK